MKLKDSIVLGVVAGMVTLGLCTRAYATQAIAIVTASDSEPEADFGFSVAVSGDRILVGSPGKNDGVGIRTGAAYVFRFDGTGWVQEAKLTAFDRALGHRFGSSVALQGNYALVGATGAPAGEIQNTGAVYVFYHDGIEWTAQAKLTASDAANNAIFGCAIAMSDNLAVIGSWGNNERAFQAGAAYVFRRTGTTWTQQQKLTAYDGAAGDAFGIAVALDGSELIVGAPHSDDYAKDSGSAYVFHNDGSSWVLRQKLTTVDGIPNHFFGQAVAIRGDRVIIGAPGDADLGLFSGAAYYFARTGSNWVATTKLLPADLRGGSFGTTVALCDSYALIGARGEGAAYVFAWDGANWVEQSKLSDPSGGDNDIFGYSVAADGDYAAVGAIGVDNDRGAVYIYDGISLQLAPVHRFWSPYLSRHFYTISQAEKDYVITHWSNTWMYEGIAYYTFPENAVPGLLPVHRFWSSTHSSHFYTINEAEKDYVIANYPDFIWAYEGEVFYAFPEGQQVANTIPVYRFWSASLSSHFYTASESEKEFLITRPERGWEYEGVAWYVYAQ